MKCIKAVLAVSVAAALLVSFCGCGSISSDESKVSNDSSSESGSSETTAESEADTISTTVDETYNTEASETEETSSEEENNDEEESACYEKLVEVISNSGANGYTVGHVGGSDNFFLMLSFGDAEASRYYDVYRIDTDDVVLVQSMLVGSHTAVYISEVGHLAIYQAHMGHYGYGDLIYTGGGISIDWLEDNGVIGADEDYPDIPGEMITFTSVDDFSMIVDF